MGQGIFVDNGLTYVFTTMEDVEDVDPIEYFINYYAKTLEPIVCKLQENKPKGLDIPDYLNTQLLSLYCAKVIVQQTMSKELPGFLSSLIDKDLRKKEQEKLLKGVEITIEQLGSLFYQAVEKGYKFSSYNFQIIPNEYQSRKLPHFAYYDEDGKLVKNGDTDLTEGEIKDLIERSSFLLVRILDNGKHWHSFLQTRKGLLGKEPGRLGSKSHIHYISDSFGISKEDFVNELKTSGKYKSTPVHILLRE